MNILAAKKKIENGIQNMMINMVRYPDVFKLVNVQMPGLSQADQDKVTRLTTAEIMDDDIADQVRLIFAGNQ